MNLPVRQRPLLCLLPGLDGTGHLYGPLVEVLGEWAEVRVLAYDACGSADYPALCEALQSELPATGELVLVAESFAGPLSVMLAARHPGRVRALVMAASFVHAPLACSRLCASVLQRMPALVPPVAWMEWVLAGAELPPSLRDAFAAILRTVPAERIKQRALAALRADVRSRLAVMDVPLLYLRAKHDRLIGVRAGQVVMAHARHAAWEEIEAPHFLFQTAPIAAARAIREFLDRLPGRIDVAGRA